MKLSNTFKPNNILFNSKHITVTQKNSASILSGYYDTPLQSSYVN
jgi:hypothetical protein